MSSVSGKTGDVTLAVEDVAGAANDALVVHIAGDQTVSGTKTFTGHVILSTDLDTSGTPDIDLSSANAVLVPTVSQGSNNTFAASTAYADRAANGVKTNLGNMSGVLDLSSYSAQNSVFTLTATGNITFDGNTQAPVAVSGRPGFFYLWFLQDATGGRTFTLSNISVLSTSAPIPNPLPNTWTRFDFATDGTGHPVLLGQYSGIPSVPSGYTGGTAGITKGSKVSTIDFVTIRKIDNWLHGKILFTVGASAVNNGDPLVVLPAAMTSADSEEILLISATGIWVPLANCAARFGNGDNNIYFASSGGVTLAAATQYTLHLAFNSSNITPLT